MNNRSKLPITPGSKFAPAPDQEQTGQQGPIRRIPASHQTQSASHAQLKPKNSKKSNGNVSRNSSTSKRPKGPKSDRSNFSDHSASRNGVLKASKNVSSSRSKHESGIPMPDNQTEDAHYLGNTVTNTQQRKLLQQGHSSCTNSELDQDSQVSDEGREGRSRGWVDRETARSQRELPAKQGSQNCEVPIKATKRRHTQHHNQDTKPDRYLQVEPRHRDNNFLDPDDLSYNQEDSNQHHSNVQLTGSNESSAANNMYGSNQKIEYVNKQYSGYGWCCSSGEMTEITPPQPNGVQNTEETQPTVAARMLGFFGWQTTEQSNTQGNEETKDDNTRPQELGRQGSGKSPVSNTTNPSTNSIPPSETMPHKMRQQLGLTPKTNMRLFQTDNQPLKKSMLSNTSISPCSEESFVHSIADAPRQQKPSDLKKHQPPKALRTDQRSGYNGSTHSYDYHSSLGGESNPPSSSIVDNLHALSVDIKRREKELELQASHSSTSNQQHKKLRTIGGRRETEQTISQTSQIPEEGESGGPQPRAKKNALTARRNTILSSQSLDEAQNQSQTQKQSKQVSINFESVIMLENKLNRITNGLQKIRHAEAKAILTYNYERQSIQANENFRIQLDELIGLCEEYWSILRSESFLFCQLPQRMFKDNPRLVHEIKRTFVLKLVVVSEIGFLISNEDFTFADSHLKDAMLLICKGFLTFMRVILSKLTTTMLQTFFWARKLEEIVTQKMKVDQADDNFRMNIRCNSPNPSALSGQSAVDKLRKVNSQTVAAIQTMFEDVDRIRMNPVEGYDVEKYDHKLFAAIHNILGNMDSLTFREVSTLIGQSLVGDFSELEDQENTRIGGRKLEGTFPNPEIKPPFLPSLKGQKKYTLVLDLDETLVHYNEEQNTVLVRPFAVKFLQMMSQLYEVVIFTAGTKDYADWALEHLANKAARHYIDHRLYRDHTIQCMEVFIKDLSYLGRDLDRTIIVDNITENFLLQPDNGITIKSWFDDPDDTCLMDMAPLLRQIVEQSVPDVRIALKESREQLHEAMASGEMNPMQRLRQQSFSDRSDLQLSSKKEVTGPKAASVQQLSERL